MTDSDPKSTPVVGIFADDLTGAFDAAAPFAARGFRTIVSCSPELPGGAQEFDVVSVNLGTRHLPAVEIVERASKAANSFVQLGAKVLLNKIDSTLRGNPGAELVAAMEVLGVDHAVLCPAYPQNGRTVEDGVLLVDGVSLASTDVGQDRLSPVRSSNVVGILLASLDKAGFGGRIGVWTGTVGDARENDLRGIVAPDARTAHDLESLASRVVGAESPGLVAGSAGIAVALANELGHGRPSRNVLRKPGRSARRVLIVTASQRTVVGDQMRALAGSTDLVQIELSADEVIRGPVPAQTGELIENGSVSVLRLEKLDDGGALSGGTVKEIAGAIVKTLGQAVRDITDKSTPDAMIVIGGDTLGGVLGACDVASVELTGELQPGTVSGTPVDGSIAGSLLVTRAGGFGDENSLVELVALLKSAGGV